MRIIEPVVVRPLLADWGTAKGGIASSLERVKKAKSRAAATRHRGHAERRLRTFLERLRGFAVLDPACGSGNCLYLALHALKGLGHRIQLEAEAMGLRWHVARGGQTELAHPRQPHAASPLRKLLA